MTEINKRPKIGVFGHYGNQNLGDEAIIEAVIKNLREGIDNCEIVGLSINPFDTRDRYQVDAFPIRYRQDFFTHGRNYTPPAPFEKNSKKIDEQVHTVPENKNLKQTLKSIPVLGFALKAAAHLVDLSKALKDELDFLRHAKAYLKDIDLLLITGSNQFLDNFGGAWGFPYTLLKWTLLAKANHTKVAYISVGAGPLVLPLSFKMLNIALKKADYVSYRDQGSKSLVESKINIDAPVYPDIAHSLGIQAGKRIKTPEDMLTVAINPMPVYDSRYWYVPDEAKFQAYVSKVTKLSITALQQGYKLDLFSTQTKDENVVDDIMAQLSKHANYESWRSQIKISKNKQLNELIDTLNDADIIVATRFHATVLPLQLNKPVLGICYYRKAAELLDDVGLNNFHVDIDDFTADELIEKFQTLVAQRNTITLDIAKHFEHYKTELKEQYSRIFNLID